MDGHGSRMTANVISVCMEQGMDILILPSHTSHAIQPLDVGKDIAKVELYRLCALEACARS